MRYASLCRRVLAWVLDGLVLFALFGLVHVLYGSPETLISSEIPEGFVLPYLGVLALFLFDQIACPMLYGTSVTCWMAGYRIQTIGGGNPSFLQALGRIGGIWVLELLSLGIITFATSLFRKDRAALHDLMTHTRAIMHERMDQSRKSRCIAATAALTVALLVFLNAMTYGVYRTFVEPTKSRLVKKGYPLKPPLRPETADMDEKGVRFMGIELPMPEGAEGVRLCRELVEEGIYKYHYFASGVDFQLLVVQYDGFITFNTDRRLLANFINPLFRLYPFKKPVHVIARESAHNGDMTFPLLSPMDNLIRLYASILYAIAAPSMPDFMVIEGEHTLGLIWSAERAKGAVTALYVARENFLEEYTISVQGAEKHKLDMFRKVSGGIRIIENPMAPILEPPICEKDSQGA